MPLAFVTMNKFLVDLGTFKSDKKKVLSINPNTFDSDAGVDLMFDEENDHELSIWENGILEAQEIQRTKANRLRQARNDISLLESLNNPKSHSMRILRTKSSESAQFNRSAEIGN